MCLKPESIGQTPLKDLKNLGPKSTKWLKEIGVSTLEDLDSLGAVEVYRQLRAKGVPASLNLVYGIEGALRGLHWQALPAEVKTALQEAVKGDFPSTRNKQEG